MKNFQEVLAKAKSLPTHIDGKLQDIFILFKENKYISIPVTEDSVINLYNELSRIGFINKRGVLGVEGFYTKTFQTFRENGTIRPKSEWETKLFYHKAWGRRDKEVKDVTYEIVGMKRITTNLPAAVLISNVKFIC